MTLRFAEIQQELKVAAAECRAASDFKRFVHAYKPALDLSDQAMLSVFRDNSVGDTGTSAYAAFKAQLVSNSLLRSARNKAAFCAEARSEFSAAFSGEGALETLISSSQPYVDLPFKDCSQTAQPPFSAAIVAQQAAAAPSVARQQVQVAQATVPAIPLAPLALRPDMPAFARVVPHHAPLVPAVPQMTRPAAVAAAAPQFDVAAPPAPPPVMFARVVPHHAPFVPSAPAMPAPAAQIAQAPHFAITPESEPIVLARIVPHHARFVPAVPSMTAPMPQVAKAPRFAIARETEPVALARVEEPIVIRHVVPRRSALRPAGLVLFHPRTAIVDAPDVEVARAAPAAAPVPTRREASDSSVARSLARLSAIAADMLKRDAADAAEPSVLARPMVASIAPAPRPAAAQVAPPADDAMATAAAHAAALLRDEPDPHPERRIAARQPLNQGTTRRRVVAASLVLPAKRGVPLSALNPTIEQSRVDQVMVAPAAHASDSVASQTAMTDQSAVVVAGRADLGTSKLAHGFVSAKATTYGHAPKPLSGDANNGETNNSPAAQAIPDAPSAALMPQDQDPDRNQNQGSDQNNDQQASPNGNQDDQYGPAYAYDDGYARARARARAWRRRIIDAYDTYRRRTVPEDYSGDYPPPPPPWRNNSSEESWSNTN